VRSAGLLFLQGINNGQSFHLAANMSSGGSFDDIIFISKVRNQHKAYFIQLKQKENSSYKIKRESLMRLSGDFSLMKFFKSYCDIKYTYSMDEDLRFCGDFHSFEFVICTNVELVNQSDYHCDDQGIFNSGGICFSFSPTTDDDIYSVFEGWKDFCEFLRDTNECNIVDKFNEFKMTVSNTEILNELEKYKNAEQILDLKTKLGDLSLYKKFLNNLKMHTGHANGEKLLQFIKKEIAIACATTDGDTDAICTKFISKITNWWENKHTFLDESEKFWKEIMQERVSAVSRMSQAKIYELDSLNIMFNESTVASLKSLISSEHAVHIVPQGNETILSSLKVYQAIKCVQSESFIITDLHNLMLHQDIILKFWETKLCGCLVLEQDKETSGNVRSLCENVTRILKEKANKKLILIGPKNCTIASNISSNNALKVCFDSCILEHFNAESENLLLNRVIEFQGHNITLDSLLNEGSSLKGAVCSDLLCLLAKKKELKIGQKLVKKIDYYIPRILRRQIHVSDSSKLMNDESPGHVLAISGMSQEELCKLLPSSDTTIPAAEWPFCSTELMPINYRILEFRDFERDGAFQKLSAMYECIHWFHNKDGKLIWKESKGNKDTVYRHLDSRKWQDYDAKNFTDIDDRVVLIAAKPGMGKTTLLTHLAAGTKELDPSIWIVRVDLNDHTNFLHKINENELEIDTVIKFLREDALKLGNGVTSKLEEQLFEDSLKRRGNVMIMFDGFDEISPLYARKVSIMLKELQKVNAGKLYVTSRPVVRQKVEEDLSTLAFTLQPLRQPDQHTFLQQVWKNKVPDVDRDLLKKFVTELLQLTMQCLSDKENEFTGIPLQTMMLAEVFESDLKNCSHTGEMIKLPPALNLLQLYDEFVKRKLNIYYNEKRKTDMTNVGVQDDFEEFYETFMENHIKCGLVAVLPAESLERLEGFQNPKRSFLKKVENGKEKTGIIDEIIDGKPHFIHKTFAEYFAAHWFSQNYARNRKVIKEIIFSPCYDVVKNIFDRILSDKKDLHRAVLNDDIMAVENALHICENVDDLDDGGRSALHLAVGHGKGQRDSESSSLFYSTYIYTDNQEATSADCITQLLLEHNADVNIPDSVLEWTPLEYADRSINNFRILGMLLEHNADPSLLSVTKQKFKDKNYIEENINVAIEQGYISLISCMIEHGCDINFKLSRDNCRCSKEYSTVLHKAVLCKQLEVARVFIDRGADVNMKDSEGNTALHLAAKEGETDAVKFLVKKKSNVSAANGRGDTPLHLAAKNGKLEVVKYLVKKGADIKILNKSEAGKTALHVAACEDNLDIVKYLYENGGQKICKRNKYTDKTPLHLAASAGKLEIVRYLAEKVNVDICDVKGNTPLHYAVSEMVNCNSDVIKCLIEIGADMYKGNMYGKTALYLAVENGKLEVLEYLEEKGANFDFQNKNGCAPLHCVAKETNLEMVKYVAERCSDIDVVDNNGDSPLMYAALGGSLHIVKYLIETRNANVYLCNKTRNTSLHYAAKSGALQLVAYLFKRFRRCNIRNVEGETPLITAAIHKQWPTVEKLTRMHTNLHAKKRDGMTVLHIASEQGNIDVVAWLLKKHFSVNLRTDAGNSVVHIACQIGALPLLKYFSENHVNFDVTNLLHDSPLHFAVLHNHADIVTYLVNKNVNVNQQNNEGSAPLHTAVQKGRLDLVKVLVDGGADVTLRDIHRRTSLYLALQYGNEELVRYLAVKSSTCILSLNIALEIAVWTNLWSLMPCLLENGSDVNFQNSRGLTALHRAASLGEVDVVNYLLNKCADVNKKDVRGVTPLLYAAFNGHLSVVQLLIEKGASVYHRDEVGNTVFHCAASFGNVFIVMFLVKYLVKRKATYILGAKNILGALNKNKMTALDVAIKKHHDAVKEYLKPVTPKNHYTATISKNLHHKGKRSMQPLNMEKHAQNITPNYTSEITGTGFSGVIQSNCNGKALSNLTNQPTHKEKEEKKDSCFKEQN
jgi:ankyrin repeat protein